MPTSNEVPKATETLCVDGLQAAVTVLLHHGAALANCAYNLSQHRALGPEVRASLREAHLAWDAAAARVQSMQRIVRLTEAAR